MNENSRPRRVLRLLRESFLPVLAVFVLLFVILAFVRFKAAYDADRATVIRIQAAPQDGDDEEADGEDRGDLEFSLARNDDPRYLKAQRLADEGRLVQAEKAYRDLLAREPSSQGFNDLGVLRWKQGDTEGALALFAQSLSTEPVYPQAYLNRGLVLAREGRYRDAIAAYRALLEHIPYHFGARLNLGVAQLRLKDYPAAIETFKAAVKLAGGDRRAKAYYNLGLAYHRLTPPDVPKARAAMTQAVRLRPGYLAARMRLADWEPDTRAGREAALTEYRRILDLRPDYAPAHFHIGLLLSDEGDDPGAIEAYRQAVRFNPADMAAHYNLGLLLLGQKQWDAAEGQFQAVLRQDPTHAKSRFGLGRVAFGRKDYKRAVVEYQEALALRKGDYPEVEFNLGLIEMALKRPKRAQAHYRKALALRPHYPQAWLNLGIAAMRQKDWAAAEADFRKALAQKPDYARAWYNLGIVATRQDRDDDAIQAYREAIAIRPTFTAAQLNLAVRLARQHRYADAVTLYREVLARDDTYASAWLNLGLAQLELNDVPAAREAFARALELEPESVKAHRFLGRAYVLEQEFDQGIPLLQAAVDMRPDDPFIRLELARALHDAGRTEAARLELKKGLALNPDNAGLQKELERYDAESK